MTAITVLRELRQTVRLGETTLVCARPVTREIYRLFAEERDRPGAPGLTDGGADDIAVGATQTEAREFVDWANSLAPDGDAYRLPLDEEAADGAFDLVAGVARHTVWCANTSNGSLSLWVPEGTHHPWVVPARETARPWLGCGSEDEEVLNRGNTALAAVLGVPSGTVRGSDLSSPDVRARLQAADLAQAGFPERADTAARIAALLHLMAEPGGGSLLTLRAPTFAERVAPLLGHSLDTGYPGDVADLATLATLYAGKVGVLPPSAPEWAAPALDTLVARVTDWSRALTDRPRSLAPGDGPYARLAALTVAAVAERLLDDWRVAFGYRGIAARFLLLQRRAEGRTTPCETIVLVRA